MELLTQIFSVLTSTISKSHWAVFALMILESTSLPSIIPAEAILITAGYYVGKGDLNWLLVVTASTVGSLVGAYINYYFALLVGRRVVYDYGKYIFLNTKNIKKLEILFTKYANILTLTGRLMPLIKHVISLPAGFCAMNKKDFTTYTAAGAAILSIIMVTLGMFMGKGSKTTKQIHAYLYIGMFVFAGILMLTYFLYNKYLDRAVSFVEKGSENK